MRLGLIGGGVAIVAAALLSLGSCTTVDTGNVGVSSSFGQVDMNEIPAGFTMKMPMFETVNHFNVRETTIDLNDLTPKARDNLSLQDMDVSVLYTVEPSRVAEILTQFSGQSLYNEELGVWMPGQGLVDRLAREAIYNAVSGMDSLTIHQRRDALTLAVREGLQQRLNRVAPNTFRITNIAIRAITTDPSIEQSIRAAVQAQKNLERQAVEERIAQGQARIAITQAEGQARANREIASSLTPEYLQYQRNEALRRFADNPGTRTVVVPGSGQGIMLNAN